LTTFPDIWSDAVDSLLCPVAVAVDDDAPLENVVWPSVVVRIFHTLFLLQEAERIIAKRRLTFATSNVRFIRTLKESEEPVDDTVWTFRTAIALTSSPCIHELNSCCPSNERTLASVVDLETYLGDQVIDVPHVLIVFWT
jgi:hypothetical protein